MTPPTKSRIFFDENTVIAEKWSLDRIAKAARPLLPPDLSYNIFIKLDHFLDSQFYFLVLLASIPNLPVEVWEATVVNDDTNPKFRCVSGFPPCGVPLKRNWPGSNFACPVLHNRKGDKRLYFEQA